MKDDIDYLGLLEALLKDCASCYPSLSDSFRKDYNHLSRQIESRGSNVLTIELPDLLKHFDMCLSKGRWTQPALPQGGAGRYSKRVGPRLFAGLFELIFDLQSGLLLDNPDINAILFFRQLCAAWKKVDKECQPKRTFKVIKEFYDDEKDLPAPTLSWHLPDPFDTRIDRDAVSLSGSSFKRPELESWGSNPSDPSGDQYAADYQQKLADRWLLLRTVQRIADRIISTFGEFVPSEWRGKHGPGAVSERFELSKFEFPSWPAAVDEIFPSDEFAHASLSIGIDPSAIESAENGRDIPISAKLIAVPKTQKGPRLIASEPIANQFLQQLILKFFQDRLNGGATALGKSVQLQNQYASQKEALAASKSGDKVTVDLKSASDRLTCWVVESLFRVNPSILNALHATRTRHVSNSIDKKHPALVEVKKYAMMGNATTFPVQSVVYAVFAIAAVLIQQQRERQGFKSSRHWLDSLRTREIVRASRQVTVYGDDIIISSKAFPVLEEILESCWFKINRSKTFSEGNFRESCGMDAFMGFDVTPAYFRTNWDESRPSSLSSLVECSNNFFEKGFWHAAEWLERTIPAKWRNALPRLGTGARTLSLRTFSGDMIPGPNRFSTDLQQWQVKVPALYSRISRTEGTGEQLLYQYFTDSPSPESYWTHGEVAAVRSLLRMEWRAVEAIMPLRLRLI